MMLPTVVFWSSVSMACLSWQADDSSTADAPGPAEIATLVEQLGDDKIMVRDRASQLLWEAGQAAEAMLKEAATSTDAEVRLRARAILEKFRHGLFADTPPEVVSLIQQFRNGTIDRRALALQKLAEMRQYDTMFRLVNSIDHATQRSALLDRFQQDSNNVIRQLIRQGELEAAERVLLISKNDDLGLLTLSAFHAAAGTLDARIEAQRQLLATTPDPAGFRMLSHYLRARGNLDAAYEAARNANDKRLERALLMELGRWSDVANLQAVSGVQPPMPLGVNAPNNNALFTRIEELGFGLAVAPRAKRMNDTTLVLGDLKQFANDQRESAPLLWHVSEAYLINGYYEDGIQWMKTAQPLSCFELLTYQQRYREAFDFVGIKDGREIDDEWLENLPASPGAATLQRAQRARLAAAVARMVHQLGRHQEAIAIANVLDRHAQDASSKQKSTGGRADLLLQLASLELRLGLLEPAFAHAEQASGEVDLDAQVMKALFGNRAEEGSAWVLLLRHSDPRLSLLKTLPLVHELMRFPVPDNSRVDQFEKHVEPAIQYAREILQQDAARGKFLDSLAVSCLVRNYQQPARRLLEVSAPHYAPSAMRLADLEAEHQNWPEAARWYKTAFELDPTQLGALYLSGIALEKAGQEDEGRTNQRHASLFALHSRSRHALAQQVQLRDHAEHAERLLRFAMNTGPFEHWETNDAARLLGDLIAERQPAEAAGLWERHMLANLRTIYNFVEADSYIRFPFLIHKSRAQAAIVAGDFEEANRQIEEAWRASPNDVRLAEDLVPLLDKAGRAEDSRRLFDRTFDALSAVVVDYPDSAFHRNNLAWLSARCHRHLDKALTHAQEAVRLQGDNPSYLDTLAEVHFHLGARDEAIRLSEAARRLSPRHKTFKEQLARFQSDPLPKSPMPIVP